MAFRKITLAGPARGSIFLPGCKSHSNRALICAAIARGTSRLLGVSAAEDTQRLIRLLVLCGVSVEAREESLFVHGTGEGPKMESQAFDVADSGTVLRFLLPYVASGRGPSFWTGTPRMRERPLEPLLRSLESLGARFEFESQDYRLPFRMESQGLRGGVIPWPGTESSQFASGLLLSAPIMTEPLSLRLPETPLRSQPYLAMTLAVQESFGLRCVKEKGAIQTQGTYRPHDFSLPGDPSAAFWFFAAVALAGGEIRLRNLRRDAISQALSGTDLGPKLGFRISWLQDGACLVTKEKGGAFEQDFSACPDLVPAAVILALEFPGKSRITGAPHLRWKESDRIAALGEELRRCGASIEALEDGFSIEGGKPLHAAILNTHNDHRLAAAFALLGLRVSGVVLSEDESIAKSYPRFFEDFEGLFDKGEEASR